MLASWVMDEMKTSKLNDRRLNRRLGEVLSQLAARPTASIPAACGGRAEMVAAYRFCENEKTSFQSVLQPHVDATRERMAAQPDGWHALRDEGRGGGRVRRRLGASPRPSLRSGRATLGDQRGHPRHTST